MEGRLCIVMAAYDEAKGLDALLPKLPVTLHGMNVYPIVVSDGSTDATAEVAAGHGADVVAFDENRGKGAAMRAGIGRARELGFEVVVTMDADGQHSVGDLPALVAPLAEGKADVVYGSRYAGRRGRRGVPLNRYVVRRATVGILERLLSETFTDPYCGFRAFSRRAIGVIRFDGDRYQGELEAIFDVHRHGLAAVEVPVSRIYGEAMSKMGARRGKVLGRIEVLFGYAQTIARKARERHGSRESAPVVSHRD